MSESWDMESTTSVVSLILGHGIVNSEEICRSVPINVQTNASFIVSTETLKSVDDI